MKTDGFPSLRRLLGEALAIFIGVAAALAGQAWFEARAERIAEREFLQVVLEELGRTEDAVTRTSAEFEQQRELAVHLATLLSLPTTPAIGDSIAGLAPRMSRYDQGTDFDAIDVLLAPESVRLVHDAGLRSELRAFRESVAGLQASIRQNADFALSEWRAVGIEYFNYRVAGGFWRDEPEPPPVSRHVRDGARLASSPEFENLIDLSIAQYRNVLADAESTMPLISELRRMIGDRLAAL